MICDFVNGKTKVLGILGNPVSHTFSPFIHNTISKKINKNYIYLPFPVEKGSIGDAVKGAHALNIQGLNVTVPYKKEVLPYLLSIEKTAELTGAVNTLKFSENGYKGYNTDTIGIMNTLKNAEVDIYGKNVVILGAGGAACAVLTALCESGAKNVYIVNRTASTSSALAERISPHYKTNIICLNYPEINSAENVDSLIQTTTLGFGNQRALSPVEDKSFLKRIPFVFDLIYSPWETKFLHIAKECGCKTVNGFDMLVYQAFASYEIWTGETFEDSFIRDVKNELIELL